MIRAGRGLWRPTRAARIAKGVDAGGSPGPEWRLENARVAAPRPRQPCFQATSKNVGDRENNQFATLASNSKTIVYTS